MEAPERRPWDQMEGESSEGFARFLTYLAIGPGRTLPAAWAAWCAESPDAPEGDAESEQEGRKRPVPGQWRRECTRFGWVERAARHDVSMISARCERTVAKFLALIDALVDAVLAAVQAKAIAPRSFSDVLDSVTALGGYIPPELAARMAGEPGRLQLPAPAPPVESSR